jgi:ABC-2 type transport system ATP-binding protein
VQKSFGSTLVIRGVSFEVRCGERLAIIGPNGAGKSTLTKIACGLVRPTHGAARVCGHPAGSAAARSHLGYLAELFRFPGFLSADELLRLHQRLARSEGGAAERERLLELVGLADAATLRVQAMSKGMQQRLGIAQALVGGPQLLLLDEPTSALDPGGRHVVRDLLVRLREERIAVLLNSHLLSELELVCDRIVVVDRGKVVGAGTPAELTRPRGVEIETTAGTRIVEGVEREGVPALVRSLIEAGEEVLGVRILRSTLEEAYLELVGEGGA